VETWRHIADAAAPLFLDRSLTEVRMADVAEAAGVSTSTVYHQLGSVTAVAAAGWARHIPELQAISELPITIEEGPLLRIEQVLTRYVQLAKESRGATEALVIEIMNEVNPSAGPGRRRSIRETVPLPELLVGHVRELRVQGLLRRRIDTFRLARSLVQLVTIQVLMFPDDPVERIVDETMGMAFEGSLVTGAG
jgi:AcrR family transcriptional regulator